jgi:hypothetical protein
MAGLDPAIHALPHHRKKTWMRGSSPRMTIEVGISAEFESRHCDERTRRRFAQYPVVRLTTKRDETTSR